MELRLSQNLLINNRFTISVPGETDHYYGICDEYGNTEDINLKTCFHALTDRSKEVWRGETVKSSDGPILGKLVSSV